MNLLFLDCETSSDHPKKDSINPWRNCWLYSFAYAQGMDGEIKYQPVNWQPSKRQDPTESRQILRRLFSWADVYINSNPKYDLQVLTNFDPSLRPLIENTVIYDTVTAARLIDSDRWSHGEEALCKDWLGIKMEKNVVKPYTHKNGRWYNKDFGSIPHEAMKVRAVDDVANVRRLYKYIEANIPADSRDIWEIEKEVTSILYGMERVGLQTDSQVLLLNSLIIHQDLEKHYEVIKSRVGRYFRPDHPDDCYDLLCNHYGLPVLGITEKGKPSFDKHAMALYKTHPEVLEYSDRAEVVNTIAEFRKQRMLLDFFVNPYLELIDDDGKVWSPDIGKPILHSSYNQTVRTGRMSCMWPNAQQLSPDAKKLILGDWTEIDYSQMEFRLIAHYLGQPEIIQEICNGKDYHTVVAELTGLPRKLAKNINFAMAYGAGKKKILAMIEAGSSQLAADILNTYGGSRKRLSEGVYSDYHRMMYKMRPVMKQAEQTATRRGSVRNYFGRYRKLGSYMWKGKKRSTAYKAFNTVIQSGAADGFKVGIVKLKRKGLLKDADALVHDSIKFQRRLDPEESAEITAELEDVFTWQDKQLTVPLPCDVETGSSYWGKR